MAEGTYFAQLTDIHISPEATVEAANAERYLARALQEIAGLRLHCQFAVITGDVVSAGTEGEFRRYLDLVANCDIPLYAIPSGTHDAWDNEEPWSKFIGRRRYCLDAGDLRLVLLGEQCIGKPRWQRQLSQTDLDWLEECLKSAGGRPLVLAFHAPLLHNGHDYVDVWAGGKAQPLLDLVRRYHVTALLTGHWHLNGEWQIEQNQIRVINTGALCGWGWNGIPPAPRYGLRPGYRLVSYEAGELRSIWRDLGTPAQINLTWVGDIHTAGPRPQVRDVAIGMPSKIQAQSFSLKGVIEKAEWALCRITNIDPIGRVTWNLCEPGWQPLELKSSHLWSEWEATVHPEDFSPGDGALVVRAWESKRVVAYDAVPVHINHSGQMQAGNLHLFVLWSPPCE
ncbi:MAG TPA: hypothetical protein GXZ82_01420 [Firmicutes bacterium]|nr:hypothetical protein [Bacillota bacterium]